MNTKLHSHLTANSPPSAFFILSHDRSIASAKVSAPHRVRSSASSFNSQYSLIFLMSSSSCLRLFPRLPLMSVLTSTVRSILCFVIHLHYESSQLVHIREIVICCENHTTAINRLCSLIIKNSQFLAHPVLTILYDSNIEKQFNSIPTVKSNSIPTVKSNSIQFQQ
jgi:hypothetical protein